MPNQLSPVWKEIERLLDDGISLIPVRDRDEPPYVKKTPYRNWKQFQAKIVSKDELFKTMEQYNTTAVAMICGAVSGNVEVIDIDVKWLPGVDARLFNDLRTIYPDLFNRLRIHKSPSGGYHLIYRVAQPFKIEGNQKLASRNSTDKELETNKAKIKCFIETRGEGGYVLVPPSLGYTVSADVPIPTITTAERESLINLCRCYNQTIKQDPYVVTKKEPDNYYDLNPFEHYNASEAGINILLKYGWRQLNKSGDYVHYNRPGSNTLAIHASYIISKNLFHVFTTNTELEPDRSYKPSTLLAIFEFNGDRKKTYQWLVNNGYGQIKPSVEKQIIKSRRPLPVNASEEAKKLQTKIIQQLNEQHPHGMFWVVTDEGVKIDREAVYRVAEGLGFRNSKQEVVQIVGFFIHRRTERFFFDTLKEYIKEEEADLYNDICNAYESFLQRAGKFTIERIKLLDESLIIRDTKQTCYKFFQNGYVFITAEKYTLNEYKNISGLIWEDQVQQRQFQVSGINGKYLEFLRLACSYDEQPDHIQSIIGYLAHNFKDETTAYIIVQTEQCPDPRMGGGSGKNVFSSLFNYTTTVKTIPGAQARYDEKFLQAWNGERIFAVSDVPKRFNFEFLKELSSGTGLVKKLFKNEETFSVAEMPKFIIGTQFSYDVSDGGLRRRLIPLEFTDFFTQKGGVDVYFDAHFPNDWTGDDWLGFDNLISISIKKWLESGLKLSNRVLSESGWLKQFDHTYMQLTREFIEQNWEQWRDNFISNNDFNASYKNFMEENNIPKNISLTSQKMNKALKLWSEKHGYNFTPNIQKTVDSIKLKGREFLPIAPF